MQQLQSHASGHTLGDPLLRARHWLNGFIPPAAIVAMIGIGFAIANSERDAETFLSFAGGLCAWFLFKFLPPLLSIWILLPNNNTNAFYLRTFGTDHSTWLIRKSIQNVLGRRYRLSGIRDPRRKKSRWDYLAFPVFFLRYINPQFLNLEAGTQWQLRLRNSLSDARCVFIDVTTLSHFVEEEIRLSHKCVGLQRILFIGNSSIDESHWVERIAAVIRCDVPKDSIQIAIWNDSARDARPSFEKTVAAFEAQLPTGNAGAAGATNVSSEEPNDAIELDAEHDNQFFASSLFGIATFCFWVGLVAPDGGYAIAIVLGWAGKIVAICFFTRYMIHSTSLQRLRGAAAALVAMTPFVVTLAVVLPAIQTARP